MLHKILVYSFYALFTLTPLIWTSMNHELFEYNKMIFVYLLTILITTTWVIKMILEKRFIFKKTPLDIPLILFLIANILSTVYSIDPHTSIWGYYSRSNGGLLSIVSYLLLYWALVSNFEKAQVFNFLKASLVTGAIVSVWGIMEHFGASPSCVLLDRGFTVDCWVQRVQERVFATLGQPNWMAAYLSMLIFPCLYFFITSKTKYEAVLYATAATLYYLSFTFTYSRGATFGLIGGLILFLVSLSFIQYAKREKESLKDTETFVKFAGVPLLTAGISLFHFGIGYLPSNLQTVFLPYKSLVQILMFVSWGLLGFIVFSNLKKASFFKRLLIVLGGFLIVNLLFASALTSFKLITQNAAPTRVTAPSVGTQLENGGTESGAIRLIVWKGAIDIFKAYPIFGSGVETFAYSYYNFRPISHNLVSEWDFLYNKAHNEFLNYLSTTGIVGLSTYLLIIMILGVWVFKKAFFSKLDVNGKIFIIAILSGILSFLIQNFFQFSVVVIALFFYLFPAMAFAATDSAKDLKLPKTLNFLFTLPSALLYRHSIYSKLLIVLTCLIGVYFFINVSLIWYADTIFAQGEKASESGNPGKAYNLISIASGINPGEPFFKSELGFAAASASLALESTDASLSTDLAKEADLETQSALSISPKNVSLWRTAIRTYYQLSALENQNGIDYTQKTIEAVDKAISLAPTDPKLYYNKAIILGQMDKKDEAIVELKKAIELKPNYKESLIALGEFYFSQKQTEQALETVKQVFKYYPDDPDALKQLVDWGKQGAATESARK